ncbi:hypothetical protein J40TS1_53210 [Paenibacillus montaniterrae]|uniref:Cyclic nucleotide-binding domain-containing protein n=1 Tax=Paenibacillus montaniterrae TaxID=429341 RepID=A0A919YWB2_9BACL|nr:cyclic nucleotide-binding domain-containing protein [Paenibacillus montaniterrae]GIP19679.1 hypothetical protein J40TS1_53210 [Paenibacillus montaniterrae]
MGSSVEAIQNHTLLHGVPRHELEAVVAAMEYIVLEHNDVLIHEGEIGDCCYFIVSGQAVVSTRSITDRPLVLDVLGPGAIVGEISLLLQEKRTADVKAQGKLEALRLKSVDFNRFSESSPMFHESLLFSSRIRLLHGLLRKTTIWSSIPDAELRGLAEVTRKASISSGEKVLVEGSISNQLYMISSGRFQVERNGRKIITLGSGDCFGEVDLLLNGPYSGTVTALEDSELLIIGKEEFHYILQQYEQVHRQFIELICLRRPELAALLKPEQPAKQPAKQQHAAKAEKRNNYKLGDNWITIVLVLGGLFILLTILSVWLKHPVLIAAALFIGGLAGPVAYVSFVRGAQLLGYRGSRLALVFVVSALTAAPVALILERWLLFGGFAGSSASRLGSFAEPIVISLIEECVKLLVVVVLLRNRKQRFLMDALVFGAAVGMGFAAIESILYGFTYLQQGTAADMLAVLWLRALLSPFGHGTWTAIAAAGLWFWLQSRSDAPARPGSAPRIRNFASMIGLMLCSIVLHALWNNHELEGLARLTGMIMIGAVGILLLYLLLRKGMSDEVKALQLLNPVINAAASQHSQLQELQLASNSLASLLCDGCGTVSPPDASYCARCGQALRAKK